MVVVARHRARSGKSHRDEDALVSYLYARKKSGAARWAALESIVVESRYDRGGDFYWDVERSIEETEMPEGIAAPRRRRKWRGWPAHKVHGIWLDRDGRVLKEKEARRRNRISLTRRRRRKARVEAEAEAVPIAPRFDVFYREFSPYETREAFARVEEPPAYEPRDERKKAADEETVERLHEEYEELEAGGSPSGGEA